MIFTLLTHVLEAGARASLVKKSEKFFTKFGENFGESPNLVKN